MLKQHDQEVDANTAAKEKSVTERCMAQPQRSKNEEIMDNDDRIHNKTDPTTGMTEAIESDKMTETCDDRLGHRIMTDEDRVQRRVCQDHFPGAFHANDKDAVRPMRDTVVMKLNVNATEEYELRHKCVEDAAKSAVDEDTNGAAASKQEKSANGRAAAARKIRRK